MLLWLIAYILNPNYINGIKTKIALLIILATWFFCSSGFGDYLIAGMCIGIAIFPNFSSKFLKVKISEPIINIKLLYLFTAIFILIIVFYLSLMLGESVKEDGRFSLRNEGDIIFGFSWLFYRLMEAFSSHYYSTTQFFDGYANMRLQDYENPLYYNFQTFLYRLNAIFKLGEVPKPEVSSVSQLNFYSLSDIDDWHQGTSPGLIASFLYMFPASVALIFSLIYIKIVCSMISDFFYLGNYRLTIVGTFLILIQCLSLFQSIADFLLIFDGGFIFFLLFYLMSQANKANKEEVINKFYN